jgi:GNAT superfamily N-acetyltransferase
MLGYVLFPHFLSGELVAGEVFWWVEPGFRGEGLKLLRAAETRSRAAGAKYLQMIAPNDRVAAVYKRLDYSFVEAAYQKLL